MKSGALGDQLQKLMSALYRVHVLLFLLALGLGYGFVSWRINTLSQAEPSQAAIDSQAKAVSQPHIDPALVNKITQLQDNSVTVQSLFDQARENPFRE
ncbi:MAG TPA: hypothetical protein VF466_00360 [Candidatus Saccharimonadales bacterium]